MAQTVIHDVSPRTLPLKYQNVVWTTLEDHDLVEVGTLLYDPGQHATYMGKVVKLVEVNETTYVHINWYKWERDKLFDVQPWSRFVDQWYWWADPCMQPEEEEDDDPE